jgi:hypothetical protein
MQFFRSQSHQFSLEIVGILFDLSMTTVWNAVKRQETLEVANDDPANPKAPGFDGSSRVWIARKRLVF